MIIFIDFRKMSIFIVYKNPKKLPCPSDRIGYKMGNIKTSILPKMGPKLCLNHFPIRHGPPGFERRTRTSVFPGVPKNGISKTGGPPDSRIQLRKSDFYGPPKNKKQAKSI